MTHHHPLVPAKAVELLEAAGVPHAARLIRDHAATGLVRSYASMIETFEVAGPTACVRGAAVPTALWRRIIAEGVDADVWTGGTVRLAPDELIGGAPAVNITGIGFNETDLRQLIDQHGRTASARSMPQAGPPIASPHDRRRIAPDLSFLHAGALQLTVAETKAALSIGQTTLYKLLKEGELERAPSKAGTRITAASVRRYAGLAD